MNTESFEDNCQYVKPDAMDRHLDVLQYHADGGLLLGASSLTGPYWLGSLWFYTNPESAPDVDSCTAGVQLEAGLAAASWVDKTHVLVGLDTGDIAVWKLEDNFHTFVLSHSESAHDGVITSVSVTANSTQAISAAQDHCIKVWDLPSASLVYSTRGHSDEVCCVDSHPTEQDLFLSCAQDNRILLWDRRKPKPASIICKKPLKHIPTCLSWQPGQANKFAVGSESGQLTLLDIRTGVDNFLTAQPHNRAVHRLTFCQEKPSLLASVGEDCRTAVISMEETDSMDQIYSDMSHTDFVQGATWPTVSQLYTCGWDSRIYQHSPGGGAENKPKRLGQPQKQETGATRGLTNGHCDVEDDGKGDGLMCGNKSSYSQAVRTNQEIDTQC